MAAKSPKSPTKAQGRKYAAAAALGLSYHADAPANSGGTFWALDAEGVVHLVKVRTVAGDLTAETVEDRRAGTVVNPWGNKRDYRGYALWTVVYPAVALTVPTVAAGLGPVAVEVPEDTMVSLVWNTAD